VRNAASKRQRRGKTPGWQPRKTSRRRKKSAGAREGLSDCKSSFRSTSTPNNPSESQEPDASKRTYECGRHPGILCFGSRFDEFDRPEIKSVIAFESERSWPNFRLGKVLKRFFADDNATDYVHVQYYGFDRAIFEAAW
jgi:hypothetical protein